MGGIETTLSAALFRDDMITPEVRAFNAEVSARQATVPGPWEMGIQATRAARRASRPPAALDSFDIDTGQDVLLHVVPCAQPRAVYLHIHGGGMALGSAWDQDALLQDIAQAAQITCASVEYRLAPEYPYPYPWDDCERAACWLLDHARVDLGAELALIGGESAGALLSVATMTRLRDRHGFAGLRGAALSFGAYDTTMTPSQRAAKQGLLRAADIVRFANAYAPDTALHRNGEISPLFADLHGLPPALFTVGTLDAMVDDSLFMHSRWLAHGNESQLAVYPGADHGFLSMRHPLAPIAIARIGAFLGSCVSH